MNKLIELWKTNCEHCEAVKHTVEELIKDGYEIKKHNIEEQDGFVLMNEYMKEIDQNYERLGYDTGFIYTPTFINPQARSILSFMDREPTREELVKLAEGGESK